ncbi:MAG: hemolysin family protein [Patescibacteria group bacterium]|nr:hemolysin family protein [Patescibacteria group bacterium]MDD4304117.1 hemolysin family protein [Patescibacteria group bacterium]MDD4694994.1 hemolysin family protein [Patescibacteria group bacterium]
MFFVKIIILLILSAFFSGTEIALFSMTPATVKSLVLARKKNSKLVEKLLRNKKRLLVTILLGNNLVNISAAGLASLWVQERFHTGALTIATGTMTLLILIFGEMYPKALFQTNAEKFALIFSPIIYFLEIIGYPIIILLEKLLIILTKNKTRNLVSEQELKAFSRLAVENGVLQFKEHEMIMNVLNFEDKSAKEIMTPRYKMSILNDEAEVDQVSYFMAQEGYSRYPVYHNQEDNIIGYVHVIDIMKVLNSDDRENPLSKYVDPIIKFDENTKLDKIFKKMIRNRIHIALIYRKKEQLLGMVTLEDVLEEIVGEIQDENDVED